MRATIEEYDNNVHFDESVLEEDGREFVQFLRLEAFAPCISMRGIQTMRNAISPILPDKSSSLRLQIYSCSNTHESRLLHSHLTPGKKIHYDDISGLIERPRNLHHERAQNVHVHRRGRSWSHHSLDCLASRFTQHSEDRDNEAVGRVTLKSGRRMPHRFQ